MILPRSAYVTAAIFDQKVFICRGKDNVLRGFYNVCAHRAHELLSGTGKAKVITCPYHAWSYHLTGELRLGTRGGGICRVSIMASFA